MPKRDTKSQSGVELIRLANVWKLTNYCKKKIVLRNRELTINVNKDAEIDEYNSVIKSAYDFTLNTLNSKYNFLFGIPKKWIGRKA